MNTDLVHSPQRTRRKFERDCAVRLGNVNPFFYEIRLLDAFCFTLGMADVVADHPSFTCNLAYTSHYRPPDQVRNIEQTRRYVKDGLDRFGGESVGFLWRRRAVRTKNRDSAIIAEFCASCGSFCVCQEFSQLSAWDLNIPSDMILYYGITLRGRYLFGIALVSLLLSATVGVAVPQKDKQSVSTDSVEFSEKFLSELAEPLDRTSNSWSASTEVLSQTSTSVRLLYKAHVRNDQITSISVGKISHLFCSSTVGIPLQAEVSVNVIEARIALRQRILGPVDDISDLNSGPVAIGEQGMLRRQNVITLGFGPKIDGDEVVIYDHIEVEVLFSESAVQKGWSGEDRWGEMLYRNTVINYEQARRWRHQPVNMVNKVTNEPSLSEKVLKVTVRNDGLYKITGADMEEAGIKLDSIDPTRFRMLYGGGGTLGLARQVPRGFDRREIPIVVEDGRDGIFDTEDYVLFYGQATQRWDYDRNKKRYFWRSNVYTEDNVYFLDTSADGTGLRVAEITGARDQGAPFVAESYRERVHMEDDQFILVQLYGIKSGYDWYWEDFGGNARNFPTIVRDAVTEIPVDVRIRFWGWTNESHRFDVYWNDNLVKATSFSGTGVDTLEVRTQLGPKEGLNQLGLFHRDNATTRLDWIELEFERQLSANAGELMFSWPSSMVPGDNEEGVAAEFVLSGFDEGERPRIFEISVIEGVREVVDIDFDQETGVAVFQAWFGGKGVPPKYIAAIPSRWARPAHIKQISPARLRSPDNGSDYIVLAHGDFLTAADRLAEWRSIDDRFGKPMKAMSIDIDDVYNEFSGGLVDPMAIRSFINYAVDNWDPAPYFVCLMGDGTYDYKNNNGTSHPNWIPPYQDGKSMYDEWYVRVAGEDMLPDLAIGRLCVQSAVEADGVVNKIISYETEPEVGPWQTRMLLVSDDLSNPQKPGENESFFILDAESMAKNFLPTDLDLIKLYIAKYPLEGRTKPQARDEFIRRFNEGALILTYLGHGNPDVLAHEQMFVLSRDAGLIDNGKRLPFMYTAASQVGVFDEPNQQSMPEALMNRPDGGVIGFISATRVGFHVSNMYLAREFHRLMYRTETAHVPVGQGLAIAKQNVSAGNLDRVNIQRYSLIGDPAMRIARPRFTVELKVPESIQALQEVSVQGRVFDFQGRPVDDFNGSAVVQAFDSTTRSLLETIIYTRTGAPIFRGFVSVEDGRFAVTFRVPKDISYGEENGRISAYVWSDDSPSGFGAVSGLELAGTASDIPVDETGPEIVIGFQGQKNFNSGDLVPAEPVLIAAISDPSGINITGETGHEIGLFIDDRFFAVTEFFNNTGDYKTGILEFPLPAVEPGNHTLRLKAWDTFNNSSRVETIIQVAEADNSVLSNLLFHPNPMTDQGDFTYTLSESVKSVRIRVFSVAGRLVEEIEGAGNQGFNQVSWTPIGKLANGTYLYSVDLLLENGAKVKNQSTIQVMK